MRKRHRKIAALAAAGAFVGLATGAAAQSELPEMTVKAIGLNIQDHRLVRRRGAVLERDHPGGLGRQDHRRVRAGRPRRHQGPADHAHYHARGHRFRRRRHLQDGGRRPGVRGLRPRRPDARHRDRARGVRGLGAGHGPGDGGEVRHQAPGARLQPAAGLLVPRADRRARRPPGQEGPRVQQDHGRLHQRDRRHHGQHAVRRGRAGPAARRGRLWGDRHPVRQHRRLARGLDAISIRSISAGASTIRA